MRIRNSNPFFRRSTSLSVLLFINKFRLRIPSNGGAQQRNIMLCAALPSTLSGEWGMITQSSGIHNEMCRRRGRVSIGSESGNSQPHGKWGVRALAHRGRHVMDTNRIQRFRSIPFDILISFDDCVQFDIGWRYKFGAIAPFKLGSAHGRRFNYILYFFIRFLSWNYSSFELHVLQQK